MIKAVIFDCFGVLLGNTYLHRLAELQAKDPAAASQLRAVNHATDVGILGRDESLQLMADLLGATAEEIANEQAAGEVRNEPLIAYIKTLKKSYPVGLLSNISGRDRLDERFLPGQLNELFDVVIASGDEGLVKPQPEIYQMMAERLGVEPSECVFIDDIVEFCQGATAVGMQAIQFQSTSQAVDDLQHLIDRGGKKG